MGQVISKNHCIGGTHEDRTPSMAIYDDGSAFCFACNKRFTNVGTPQPTLRVEPENLKEKLEYINALPNIRHRGLSFRHDSRGYYATWPTGDYYKLRAWAPKPGEPKYIGARGHRKPWFSIRHPNALRTCVVTEGEINALSLQEAGIEADIISPGGASNFHDKEMKANVDFFSQYDRIVVLVDDDEAGVTGAIEFHKLVKDYCPDITIMLMETDANTILNETNGKDKLKEIVGV